MARIFFIEFNGNSIVPRSCCCFGNILRAKHILLKWCYLHMTSFVLLKVWELIILLKKIRSLHCSCSYSCITNSWWKLRCPLKILNGSVVIEPLIFNFLICFFIWFLFSRFRKYFVLFSPCSCERARARIIIPLTFSS